VSFVTPRASLKLRAQFFALILDHHIQAAHELRESGFTRIISLDEFSSRAVKNLHLRSLKTNTHPPHDNSDDRAPNFEMCFEVHNSLLVVYDKWWQLVTRVTLPTVIGLNNRLREKKAFHVVAVAIS